MKKQKSKWIVSLFIIGLMITGTLVLPGEEVENNEYKKKFEKLEIKSIPTKYSLMPESLALSKITKASYNPKVNVNQLGIDIPVLDLDGVDALNPSLATDGGANICLVGEISESLFNSDIGFKISMDGGETWLPEDGTIGWELTDVNPEKPVVDFSGDLGGIASYIEIGSQFLPQIDIDDITDPEAGNGWLHGAWNVEDPLDSIDVAGWNSQFSPMPEFSKGILYLTGDIDGTTNVGYMLWQNSESSSSGIWYGAYDAEYEWENGHCDVDLVTGMFWEAYEISSNYGEFNDSIDINFCQLDGTDDWWQGDWYSLSIEGAKNPDIDAADGMAYCVFEFDGGISCAYTNDNGDNVGVMELSSIGSNPHVSIAGNNILVTYIHNGNLISVISEDSGSIWEEVTVNDESGTVADDTHSVAVSGSNIAWTHEGPEYTSIFFDTAGLSVPIIEIDSVSGGIGVTVNVKNVGSGDAVDIPYSVTATGGILGKINGNTEGEISISAGGSGTISLPMLIGLGAITIEINVGTLIETVQGTQLIVYTRI